MSFSKYFCYPVICIFFHLILVPRNQGGVVVEIIALASYLKSFPSFYIA